MVQYVIVSVVLLLSVSYLGYRAYKALSDSGDPCSGCRGCAMKESMSKRELRKRTKTGCPDKKM